VTVISAYSEMDITRDFGSRILGSNPGGRATFQIEYMIIGITGTRHGES
jgi:hypothetical protein